MRYKLRTPLNRLASFPHFCKFGTGCGTLYTAGMATHKTDQDRTVAATPCQPRQFTIRGVTILTKVVGACLAIILLSIQTPLSEFKAVTIWIVLVAYFLWATRYRRHDKRVGMMIPFISFGPLFIQNIWKFFHEDRYPRIFMGYVPLILSLAFLLCGLCFGIRAVQALCERAPTLSSWNASSVPPGWAAIPLRCALPTT